MNADTNRKQRQHNKEELLPTERCKAEQARREKFLLILTPNWIYWTHLSASPPKNIKAGKELILDCDYATNPKHGCCECAENWHSQFFIPGILITKLLFKLQPTRDKTPHLAYINNIIVKIMKNCISQAIDQVQFMHNSSCSNRLLMYKRLRHQYLIRERKVKKIRIIKMTKAENLWQFKSERSWTQNFDTSTM